MATRQIAPAVCPVCGTRFTAPIESIIDVNRDPRLKSRFLQGQLNVVQCPQCGTRAPMMAPILYHDPEHELALVLMPNELNLAHTEQQKIIGDLTNALMNRLQPEQRKAYLLTPKTFFSMDSLAKAVLEAEGITPEMLERQKLKAQLINEFLQAEDEESLKKLVKEHDAELDYEFFQILTASAQAAQADGQAQIAQALLGLRSLLAEMSSKGRAAVAEVDASMGLGETITREELLSRLESTQADEEFEELVAAGRPLLDYAFFQNLTSQIEATADADRAAQLKSLRTRILNTTAKQDDEARARMQHAANLLKTILEADDPQAAVREHLDQVDDAFFLVLSANIQRAQQENRTDVAQALQQVADMIVGLMEDQLPPEIRLVNRLLNAPYPDGTRQMLEAQRDMITPEFVAGLDEVVLELEQAGNQELANHMRQVKDQAQVITQGILQTK
jgi:hypothetical protein